MEYFIYHGTLWAWDGERMKFTGESYTDGRWFDSQSQPRHFRPECKITEAKAKKKYPKAFKD